MPKNGKHRPGPIVIDRDLIMSAAFRALSGKAPYVFLRFLSKRQLKKVGGGFDHRAPQWDIINNGEINYTYAEAAAEGLGDSVFMRAVKQLVAVGFIDIAFQGTGMHGSKSRYAISNRWRKYRQDNFEEAFYNKNNRSGFKSRSTNKQVDESKKGGSA